MKPALHTRICDLFGIQYPIIQTGMGWVAGARLTAATSANEKRGSGPNVAQAAKARIAETMTSGTNQPETLSARR